VGQSCEGKKKKKSIINLELPSKSRKQYMDEKLLTSENGPSKPNNN
jgi:hypothetical protein